MEENKLKTVEQPRDRVVLVGLSSPVLKADSADEESMDELAALVETAGAVSVATVLQNLPSPNPRSFIGEGKVAEIKELIGSTEATMAIFDNDLSPSQMRVLTEDLGVQVLDRSGLILDIFAQRAKTKEGRLQVELAQYQYLLPRLIGMWTHLERQAGTSGKGPIGSKGPGETQLETDRRHIHRKIDKLKEDLDEVRRVRGTQRERRMKNEIPVVAIVGYTNAGKSTLMNLLTQAGVLAEDKLFATLDPTARALKLPGGKTVMLIDTVGLVRRLPHHLVEAFRSTLEQAATADIILNVCDASSPEARTHLDVTNEILQSLGCGDRPVIPVLNKWDLVGDADSALHLTGAVRISALKNEGIPALLQAIEDNLPVKPVNVTALLPFAKTGIAAQLRKAGALVSEEYVPEGLLIHARVEPREMALIKPYIVENNSESENV